jgi:hypothetical protein
MEPTRYFTNYLPGLLVLLVATGMAAGCTLSDPAVDDAQYSACPCKLGWACMADVCRKECGGPADCQETEVCHEGLCYPLSGALEYQTALAMEPVKLDMLWVVDNSASMCQEQWALSQQFDQFVEVMQDGFNVDLRVAVTTTDAISNAGKFVNTPATKFPPACAQTESQPCVSDVDCVNELGPGWSCKDYPPDQWYNFNGSINSYCRFECDGDFDCCAQFCVAECGDNQSCIDAACDVAPSEDCTWECVDPGGGGDNGCMRPPDTADCPTNLPTVLTGETLDLFKCIATVAPEQFHSVNVEAGLKAAQLALDPTGPNAEQSAGFLRDDAYLMVVFITDEDDCSIHENYGAPNATCDDAYDEEKCADSGGSCKLDVAYSYIRGKEAYVCAGTIKKDYFNVCGLLGDYKGYDHHVLSYDLTKSDCQSNEDCDDGWYCKESSGKKKCRPLFFSFPHIADYFNPPGAPIFSLKPVYQVHSFLKGLKDDPARVLVAAVVGDSLVGGSDAEAMISDKCLGDQGTESEKSLAAKLHHCVAYKEMQGADSDNCADDPAKQGCEEYLQAQLECARQCFVASKGNAKNVQTARNSYICSSEYGKADFGNRYVRLADMFGPNGTYSNICSPDGIGPALGEMAQLVKGRTVRMCLPRKPELWEKLTISKQVLAEEGIGVTSEELVEGPDGDYVVEYPSMFCCLPDADGQCTGSLTSVLFTSVPDADAQVTVSYGTPVVNQE